MPRKLTYTIKNMGRLDPLGDPKDGHILTRAIIDTIHEPLIILDEQLRIIAASRSFYDKFSQQASKIQGKRFYEIGKGVWNIEPLKKLLEKVIPDHKTVESYEVEYEFPTLGKRVLLVNACEIRYENGRKKMLLSIFDISDQRALELEREKLLLHKDMLLKEMRHRIANSLQIIASILLLKAEMVESKESRLHLEDAHERIMSIAAVQEQLDAVGRGEPIAVGKYLTNLCNSLSRSMIGGRKPISLEVKAGLGDVSTDTAVSFGLITTELVINALKHAFREGQPGEIVVTFKQNKAGWTLSVGDNGVGEAEETKGNPRGLGTSIVAALAKQLHAVITTTSSPEGTKVSLLCAS